MPVRRYAKIGEARVRDAQYVNLVDRLASEWAETQTGRKGRPIIIEEREQRAIHLYVVWSLFNDIGHQQRSEIIMDAFGQVDPDSVVMVTLAMGLTKPEAQRMGIDTHLRQPRGGGVGR